MRLHRASVIVLVLSAPLIPLRGQAACLAGPGTAFGITSYQCASCGVTNEPPAPTVYSFYSEPTVLAVTGASALRRSDVIESIDGHPITTREGADAYGSPRPGPHVIVVRRNGRHVSISTVASCDAERGGNRPTRAVEPPDLGGGSGAASGSRSLDGLTITQVLPTPSKSQSRFGFAVACQLPCTKVRPPDGPAYWKYDSYPTIAEVRPASPAEHAGLKAGDVVLRIDGFSVLEQEGAVRLYNSETATSLKLTVTRRGREFDVVMQSW